jgi:hypothetical protein
MFGQHTPLSAKPSSSDTPVRLKYEPQYDLLSAWIGAPQEADNVEIEPGLVIRISRASGRVVGLEVADVSARFSKDRATVQSPAFVRSLLDRYSKAALEVHATCCA